MSDIDDRLRELDSYRSPVTWQDVERRPSRIAPRDRMVNRLAAAAVAFVVFAGGGWLAWSALGAHDGSQPVEPRPGTVTVTFDVKFGRYADPSGTLMFEGRTQQAAIASFGWENGIYDTSTPELASFLALPRGAELIIEGTARSVTGALGDAGPYPFEIVERLDLSSGRAVLDVEPGRFALSFEATWPEGTVPFYFGIEIVEAAPTVEPTAPTEPTDAPRYQGNAFVLDEPDRDPVLCLGGVADSLPPQCGGIPIVGWDWDAVEAEETHGDTTWGSYHVTGTYDGERLTVLEAGPYRPEQPSGEDPVDTPCAEPEGGWTSPDISMAGDPELRELMRAVNDDPDFAGFWIDYVDEDPIDEAPIEAGNVIANIGYTGDPESHLDDIRQIWGGPVCLVRHQYPYDDLRRIQRALGEGGAGDLGLEMTWSSVDVQTNVVELGVVIAEPAQYEAVAERYGDAVELFPALEPVG